MTTIKLAEGKRKIKSRLDSSNKISPLQYYRKRQRADKLYRKLQRSYTKLSKEEQEYLDAINQDVTYPGFYTIEDDDIVEINTNFTLEDAEKLNKEQSEYLKALSNTKSIEKAYLDIVGVKNPKRNLGTNLTDYRQEVKLDKKKYIDEEKAREKAFYENQLTDMRKEFNQVLTTKPSQVGKPRGQYNNELNTWISNNEEVLGKNYNKAKQIISGNFNLSLKQKRMAEDLEQDLLPFQTYKGASSTFSQQLLSKKPEYTWITPKGAPIAIRIPYYSGQYEIYDPKTDKIITKQSKIVRYGSSGNPILQVNTVGLKNIQVTNPLIKEYVLQKGYQSGKYGYKGSYSQDAAGYQRINIAAKLSKPKPIKRVTQVYNPYTSRVQESINGGRIQEYRVPKIKLPRIQL